MKLVQNYSQEIKTMHDICPKLHHVKSVHIRSFSGPYSVQMRKNTYQKNSEYGLFLCSVIHKATRVMSEGWPKDRRNQKSIVDIKNYLEIPNIHNIITWLQNP